MTTINGTEYLTLAEAARLVNKHPNAIWRWATKGVRGVKLATIMLGRQRLTTEAALEEFARTLAGAARPADLARLPRIPRGRSARGYANAVRVCEKAGL